MPTGPREGKTDSPLCIRHMGGMMQCCFALSMKTFVPEAAGFILLAHLALAQETNSAVNIAIVATPSSSYVSGDTRETALNDGSSPQSSRGDRRGSYGNWPRTGTQWVQYDWSQPISTKEVQIYWWDDRQGVRLPAGLSLLAIFERPRAAARRARAAPPWSEPAEGLALSAS